MTNQIANTGSPWASWPLDKEIVIARVVDADREAAFEAWTDAAQIVQWFGPEGFRIESHEADIRAGGVGDSTWLPLTARASPIAWIISW